MTTQITIIPAIPGWFTVAPMTDDNSIVIDLWEDPVIAWKMEIEDNEVASYPITDEGSLVEGGYLLKRPDGTFIEPHFRSFGSKEAVIEYYNVSKKS